MDADTTDLMHHIIETDFPFVSDCDINAVKDVYNGKDISDVSGGSQKSF